MEDGIHPHDVIQVPRSTWEMEYIHMMLSRPSNSVIATTAHYALVSILIVIYSWLYFIVKKILSSKNFFFCVLKPIKCQCSPDIETSQLICTANQLTGFYMGATLAFDVLKPRQLSLFP